MAETRILIVEGVDVRGRALEMLTAIKNAQNLLELTD